MLNSYNLLDKGRQIQIICGWSIEFERSKMKVNILSLFLLRKKTLNKKRWWWNASLFGSQGLHYIHESFVLNVFRLWSIMESRRYWWEGKWYLFLLHSPYFITHDLQCVYSRKRVNYKKLKFKLYYFRNIIHVSKFILPT